MSNSERYPKAWTVYVDCVRKWEIKDLEEYPDGWQYGIPNPEYYSEYLYSNCPGKLFILYRNLFYRNKQISVSRELLWKLEMMDGKISESEYNYSLEAMLSR